MARTSPFSPLLEQADTPDGSRVTTESALRSHAEHPYARQLHTRMVDGWVAQQAARNLNPSTVRSRVSILRRFQQVVGGYPWQWGPADLDSYIAGLRAAGLALSTVLVAEGALRQFSRYASDPGYPWAQVCRDLFGRAPVPLAHPGNSARHAPSATPPPAARAMRPAQVQHLLDTADARVAARGPTAGAWWLAAFRDSVILKVSYAFGLRVAEVQGLDVTDFSPNPRAPFGAYGVCHVRHGKSLPGQGPKRRSVLTVPEHAWIVPCLHQWIGQIRPRMRWAAHNLALFPSGTGQRLSVASLEAIFVRARDEANLPDDYVHHSLRRSYITHLTEANYDSQFIQAQAGHEYASSTVHYIDLAPDYRRSIVAAALADTASQLSPTPDREPEPGASS